MQLYIISSEDENSVTYEYNTAFTWLLYLLYAITLYGISLKSNTIQLAGCILIILYFGIRFYLGKSVSSQLKDAYKTGSVVVSGSRFSFKDPLRFKIIKEN